MDKKVKDIVKDLTWSCPHIAKEDRKQIEKAAVFAEGYKEFLDEGKTERECVRYAVKALEAKGYKPFDKAKKYKAGDKVYSVNRKKAIIATTFGKEALSEGLRINGAHIDSPRLDLKPNPLYEKEELAYFKTHYYGGIKKYQWVTLPLALHGIVIKKDGSSVDIVIGEDEKDPVFYISDLLPHLSANQNQRKLSEGIKGEELNIILGSLPFDGKDIKEEFKLMVLSILNEKYGICERDFVRAEIEAVPANKARDIGFDRSLIGAYGQDDRVCAYTALMAELECKKPKYTTVTILTDKEEIGSMGNTGLNSHYVYDYIGKLCDNAGVDIKEVCEKSSCLSSDVNAAYDPVFADAYEAQNSCYLNHGCVLTKYTGVGGKYSSSDASAEFMSKIIGIMDKAGVYWQIGELGAVDVGGGGTVAQYVAALNIDVVDLGVPIISMHSPFEVSSKLDVYNTYLAFKAFYEEK